MQNLSFPLSSPFRLETKFDLDKPFCRVMEDFFSQPNICDDIVKRVALEEQPELIVNFGLVLLIVLGSALNLSKGKNKSIEEFLQLAKHHKWRRRILENGSKPEMISEILGVEESVE